MLWTAVQISISFKRVHWFLCSVLHCYSKRVTNMYVSLICMDDFNYDSTSIIGLSSGGMETNEGIRLGGGG